MQRVRNSGVLTSQGGKFTQIGNIRDEFEFGLLNQYFSNPESKYQPILGICRGMQVLTVSQKIPQTILCHKLLQVKPRH